MEKIKNFLKIEYGSSFGFGSGSGYGDGYGFGCGFDYGSGSSSGDGYGSGYGGGFDNGSGSGWGSGSGCGYNFGGGYGHGSSDGSRGSNYGNGYDCDIKAINGMTVVVIDGIQTVIKSVVKNIARGFIVCDDLTLKPCYVAKENNLFAHGKTVKEALSALQEKIFENMNTDEVIEEFLKKFELDKKYPAKDFYHWHHILTGSCKMGRDEFINSHEIDLESGLYTVKDFIELTKNSYRGEVIKQLEAKIVL